MSDFNPLLCPRCGTVRAAQTAPLDLCPACLLATALSMDDEPPYRVLTPISDDAGGVTYLAQALTGARGHVALKVLGPRDDVDTVLSRYQHWKPVLAGIQHPGVGKLLDVGLTVEGQLYVASEYVAGWPLSSLGSRAGIDTAERVDIARQLTGAVEAAHAAGVVHLKLDASRMKISMANGTSATILGFGSSLVIDGTDGHPDVDRLALARILVQFGLEP
jgi:eukaryotic-like serine/threonine-protein kinase